MNAYSPEGPPHEPPEGESHPALPSTRRVQWVTFMLRDEWFGVPVLSVREVLRDFRIERAPGSPSFVLGLINLRGEIVTVVDARNRLGAGSADAEGDDDRRIVVLEYGKDVVGLLVDRVMEVVALTDPEVEPPPAVSRDGRDRFIHGVAARPAGLLVLLEPEALCRDEEQSEAVADALF